MADRHYPARITRVIDGDTMVATIDLGFDTYATQTVRVFGINAPETSTPEGRAARDYATQWIAKLPTIEWPVELVGKSQRDKYGRRLADIGTYGADAVAAGHAKPWDGRGTKPV